MPDGMVVGQPVPQVKGDATGVGDAAGQKQPQAVLAHMGEHRLGGGYHGPAHDDIQRDQPAAKAPKPGGFKHNPQDRQPPDDAKEGPTPRTTETDQGEGRVGAGDEHQDGGVIEDAEQGFGAWMADGMVEGRGQIKEDQGGAEDRTADDMPGGAVMGGEHDEDDQAGDGQERPQTVGDAVGDLFAFGVSGESGGGCHGVASMRREKSAVPNNCRRLARLSGIVHRHFLACVQADSQWTRAQVQG